VKPTQFFCESTELCKQIPDNLQESDIGSTRKRILHIYLKVSKAYQGIMANNEKESENYQKINTNFLKIGSKIVTNPQYISHQVNVFFVKNMDRTSNNKIRIVIFFMTLLAIQF
jgi:hypothetical protein